MRIHTAFVGDGIPACQVLGALSDHYRLMWQFGADPLMFLPVWRSVIIHTTERILAGPIYRSIPEKQSTTHPLGGARNVRDHRNFPFGLAIPMAVT